MDIEPVSVFALRDVLVVGLVLTTIYSYWRDGTTPTTMMALFLTLMWVIFRVIDYTDLSASITVVLFGLAFASLTAQIYYAAQIANTRSSPDPDRRRHSRETGSNSEER